MTKRIFALLAALLCFSTASRAEVIELKSNKIIQGKVVDSDAERIRVDVGGGTIVTFYQDEIRRIDYQDTEVKHGHAFLWKATSAETTVYLFGSIHLGRSDMYPLADPVEKAFQSATVLVVEVDIDREDPLVAQKKISAMGTYGAGDRLENHISAETRKKLRDRLSKYGIGTEQFSPLKPWFAALSLTMVQIRALGFEAEYGVDPYFLRRARGEKEIRELETFDQQLSFLDGLENQDNFLAYTLDSLSETETMLDQLISSWREGDAALMEKIMITDILTEAPQTRPIFQRILFDRNVRMAEQIKEFLNTDRTYFVVVGAAHLVGPQGIVELLKKKGYDVEQL